MPAGEAAGCCNQMSGIARSNTGFTSSSKPQLSPLRLELIAVPIIGLLCGHELGPVMNLASAGLSVGAQ